MLFEPTIIASLPDLLETLKEINPNGTRLFWFRGQGDANWKLLPGLARPPNKPEAEIAIIKRFKQNARPLTTTLPQTEWEWVFLLQHHGAPTRLLDWSENPLVGLFFAATDQGTTDKDGCLWYLDPIGLNKAGHVAPNFSGELPCFDIDDDVLNPYLPAHAASGLSRKPPIAALAMRYFPRLTAQSGVFTATHKDQTPIEETDEGKHVGKIIIPKDRKSILTEELRLFGVTRFTLFPELDSAATLAKEAVK